MAPRRATFGFHLDAPLGCAAWVMGDSAGQLFFIRASLKFIFEEPAFVAVRIAPIRLNPNLGLAGIQGPSALAPPWPSP